MEAAEAVAADRLLAGVSDPRRICGMVASCNSSNMVITAQIVRSRQGRLRRPAR